MTTPALSYLETILRDQSVAKAVERRRLGDALANTLHEIQKASESQATFEKLEIVVALVSPTWNPDRRKDVLQCLRAVEQEGTVISAAKDPKSLAEARHDVRDAVRHLDELKKGLQSDWVTFVQRLFTPDLDLARTLSNMPGTHKLGIQLDEQSGAGLAFAKAFPPGLDTEQAVRAAQQRIRELRQELEGSEAGEALVTFLIKAADKRATLADLTGEVLTWLREHDVLENFGVIVGSGQSRQA